MPTVDLETLIADFLAMGKRLQASKPLTAEMVFDAMLASYAERRVTDARMEEDGDMLLLQWGSGKLSAVSEPTDFRKIENPKYAFTEELEYLDFTRQILVGDMSDVDFDGSAVALSFSIGYDRAGRSNSGSNHWISRPEEIEAGKEALQAEAFVQSLWNAPVKVVAVTVGYVG